MYVQNQDMYVQNQDMYVQNQAFFLKTKVQVRINNQYIQFIYTMCSILRRYETDV